MNFEIEMIPLKFAMLSALTLAVSHALCGECHPCAMPHAPRLAFLTLCNCCLVSIVMHYDLSGKWKTYQLHKTRNVSTHDYAKGMINFGFDLLFLFLPFMTLCYYLRYDVIQECRDTWWQALLKLVSGYVCGKIWAFAIHYLLHHPRLYGYHRKHHGSPATLVAARAWEDSWQEYCVMELPSFGIAVLAFPTYWWMHLLHFAWHGYDGAAGHSGFGGVPGIIGWLFDGTYHYHHHARLTVNYAEIEWLDLLCGTHHSQKKSFGLKTISG